MVRGENLLAILITVLVILGIMYLLSFSEEFKYAIQGAAFEEQPIDPCGDICSSPYEHGGDDGIAGGDEGDGQDWLFPGMCSRMEPWYCPSIPEDGEECGVLVENCERCGCPMPTGYVCNIENRCSNYCSGHWDCDTGEICVDKDWEIVNIFEDDRTGCYVEDYGAGDSCGTCRVSDGDGYCLTEDLSEYGFEGEIENCVDNVDDCEGKQADCEDGQECNRDPWNPDFGMCGGHAGGCTDGTAPGECSNVPPLYCNNDGELINNCQECGCSSGAYVCNDEGVCTLLNGPDPNPIEDYCAQVGGICAKTCDSDYYVLEDTDEYHDLHKSCEDKNDDYVCCYPYANDDLNDCEHYGGLCQVDCSGDYYHAEVPYLDDECVFYSGEGNVCCLEYPPGEIPQNSGSEETSPWEKIFGAADPTSEDYNENDYIRLGESISLNRNYAFGFGVILVVLAFVITAYYPKFKKKK